MGIRIGPQPALDVKTIPGIRGCYRDSIVTSGANVTQWTDITGLGNHINVGGGTSPTIVAADSTIRGRPAIDFTSTQSLLTGPASNTMFAGTYTIFVVNRYDSSNCGHPTTSGRLITAHGGNWYMPSRSCSPDTWVVHNGIFDAGVLVPPTGIWTVQSSRWNGTTIENRNLTFGTRSGALAAYTANANVMTVGGTGWDGRMAEIIICNQYLDDTWMGTIYGYLRTRYGI